jgi:hypothetical protein
MAETSSTDSYLRRRRTVEAFLRERSSRLAGLYGLAADLLEDRRPDGWGYMVGHVGRELMNRLADHLDEVPLEDPGSGSPLRPEGIAGQLTTALESDEDGLPEAVRRIVTDVEKGGDRVRRRAEALVAQGEVAEFDQPEVAAWSRAWRDLQRRFASFAHLPARGAADLSPEAVEDAWRELTGLVAARIAEEPFFESLDDLLEIATDPDPGEERAGAALARLRPGTKPRFYEALADPAWVGYLRAAGMFRYPPPAIREGDMVRFPSWPEGLVLLRFAASAPEEVARAAAEVPQGDNSRVVQLLASCAAELPPELAADSGLVARILGDLKADPQLLDVGDPVARLTARLADAGRIGKAMDLLRALLWIDYWTVPSGSEIVPDLHEARFRHDEYLVDEPVRGILGALIAADGRATVKQLGRLLAGAQGKLSFQDSTRWRDEIEGDQSPLGDEVRHLLVDLLRDAVEALARQGEEEQEWALSWLEGKESEIFRRLYLYLLAGLPEEAERRRVALSGADILFSRESLPELYRLLPVAYEAMDRSDRARLIETIERGPEPQPWMQRGEMSHGEIEIWQDEWRQRLLSALEPHLGDAGRGRLEELRRLRGPLGRPGFAGGESTSWVGPTSPVGASELGQIAHDQLLALLRDFRAERHFAAPSPSGLARELAGAVEAAPSDWDWLADELPGIPPIYVGAWLAGRRAALQEGAPMPDPSGVLGAIAWVFGQQGDPSGQVEPLEPDADFYRAQQMGAELLIEILTRDQLDLGHREQAWGLIERLASATDPTSEREAATEAEPMQLALSSLRPRGASALLRYLQWLDARLPAGEGPGSVGLAAVPETELVLQRLLDEDPSIGVRAALASEAHLLAMVDPGLLEERITDFADPEGSGLARAGWQAYVDYGVVYAPLASLLADAYGRDVSGLAEAAPKLDEHRRSLAQHVAVIWRDVPRSAPDLPRRYLSSAPDVDRAQMIGLLGRALRPETRDGYQPSARELDLHRELWDARLTAGAGPLELQEFGWWWTSGRLSRPDDLKRLAVTLGLAGGKLGDLRRGIDLLASWAEGEAGSLEPSLDVLDALAQGGTALSQNIKPDAIAGVLRAALADKARQERAADLVHRFGEQGYLTLRGLLD